MFRGRCLKYVATTIFFISLLYFSCNFIATKMYVDLKNYFAEEIIDFSFADNVNGYPYNIVPNIVHFIHFDGKDLSFVEVINIKAAFINQQPDKIYIHCNVEPPKGKYWDMVKDISIIELLHFEKPTEIFGKPLSQVFHASDVARIRVLMKYGGIFLDSDTYVVKSLDCYRKFEMSLGCPPGQFLHCQLLIAHKNARFLRLWYESYHNYRGDLWYYNAGELPTTSILRPMPYLVHLIDPEFGCNINIRVLYDTRSSEWKKFHGVHLLIRHKSYLVKSDYVKDFDEVNIKTYNKTFGDMARLVLYGTTDFV